MHKDLLVAIISSKEISKETEARLKELTDKFTAQFKAGIGLN